MTAPNQSTNELQADQVTGATSHIQPRRFPLEPEPVSKHNLYVIFGCAILVTVIIFLGPYIYPLLQKFDPLGLY